MIKMNYLLIHGAYHGSWCWEELENLLESNGHKVYSITLPGHNPGDSKNVTLKNYVDYTLNFIKTNDLKNLILVGHSFGGIVISHVATIIPERLSKLIFVSGVVLKSGDNFLQMLPKVAQDKYNSLLSSEISLNEDYVRKMFFNDFEDKSIIDNTIKKMVSQPLQPYKDSAYLEGFNELNVPMQYILGKKDLAVPQEMVNQIKENLPKHTEWKFIESNHESLITSPQEIFEIINNS